MEAYREKQFNSPRYANNKLTPKLLLNTSTDSGGSYEQAVSTTVKFLPQIKFRNLQKSGEKTGLSTIVQLYSPRQQVQSKVTTKELKRI